MSIPAPTIREGDLTREERLNGWTAESLAAYRCDRDKVADVTPGNVVTVYTRPKPKVVIHGTRKFNPHRW